MHAIRAFVPILAFPLTLASWIMGFRRQVVARNLELMGLSTPPHFYWRLCLRAAWDLSAFALGYKPPPSVRQGSLKHLERMRRGPCLLLTAHFHNWERLGSDLRSLGVPLLAAAMPMRNPWANRLLTGWRKRWDLTVVSDHVSRTALTHLEANGCFALLWDQDAPGSESRGRFQGVSVRLNPLPDFLLSRISCPVYFGILLPGGRMRLIPLAAAEGVAPASLERRYHRVLEVLVRKHPEYWYGFFHGRFKESTLYSNR